MSSPLRTAIVALIASAVVISAAPSLTVKTSIPNVEVDGLENLKVTATIINTGDETLKLLDDPRGVLSSLSENSFIITNAAGSRPLFNGAKATYSPTHAADLNGPSAFTILAPGASVDVTYDLSASYNFAESSAGDYLIEPSSHFTYVCADGTPKSLYATVEDVAEVKLSGNLTVSRVHDKRAAYPGCTADNRLVLAAAASRAEEYANEAYSYLKSKSSVTPRYKLWFGHYTDARKRIVQTKFLLIASTGFSGFTYNCNCLRNSEHPDWSAYVDPNKFGIIHICPLFWSKPETGADSKAGALIHESSHFILNGRTYDFHYGRPKAVTLSIEDPDTAIKNADNYRFFAENTPFLP